MKFTIEANKLRAAIEATASIAPGEGKRPQLEATLITVAADGVLELAGTNVADALWFKIQGATNMTPGQVLIPSVNLLRLVKQADDRPLTITWDEKAGRADFVFAETEAKLPVETPSDFPAIQRFDPTQAFVTMPLPALNAMFKRVNFAIMPDFKQRALAGVNVEIKAKSVKLTATDGVRMASVERDTANISGVTSSGIVPPLQPKYLKTFSNEETDLVDIQVSGSIFALRGTRGELTRRTIVGNYPVYDLEKQCAYQRHVVVESRGLKDVLETADLLKVESATTCEFRWSKDGLVVDAASGIDGSVTAKLPVQWDHPPYTIKLNAKMLADAVKASDAKQLDLSFGDDRQPALLREASDGLLYLYAVSPKF